MSIEQRLRQLEGKLKNRATNQVPDIDLDVIIAKLGMDPVKVREVSKQNGQSLAEVISDELKLTSSELKRLLRERIENTSQVIAEVTND